jgi:hypothetical protein
MTQVQAHGINVDTHKVQLLGSGLADGINSRWWQEDSALRMAFLIDTFVCLAMRRERR